MRSLPYINQANPLPLLLYYQGIHIAFRLANVRSRQGKNNKGIFIIITKTISEPSAVPNAELKVKRTKGITKRQSSVRESKVKQEPKVKQELEVKQEPYIEQDTIIQDNNLKVVPGPAIRKKRLFLVVLKELKEPEINIQEKNLEQELLELLFVPKEKDRVAYRTRKRYILQQEDIERSAEFSIPIQIQRYNALTAGYEEGI